MLTAVVQVGLILALELTLLPALHGCWVDVCLLPLFASTLSDRLLWFQISPISFLMAHWTLGMAVLMASATFMSIFCQQLRPGELDPSQGHASFISTFLAFLYSTC